MARPLSITRIWYAQLPAQKTILQLIIMAVVFRVAVKQRKNAYYRNDPEKYGLAFEKLHNLSPRF